MNTRFDTTRENIITVYGQEHVMVINGCGFRLPEELFDPAIQRIEWAAGQGIVCWTDPERDPLCFGEEGFAWHIAPLLEAFDKLGRAVQPRERQMVILEKEPAPMFFEECQRDSLIKEIHDLEEKMARSTQAILAAQLSGKKPPAEDVEYFLSLYNQKVERRAKLAVFGSKD